LSVIGGSKFSYDLFGCKLRFRLGREVIRRHDAATNTGQPNLVLAMISVLLAATIVFILRGIFG
jgi:hypothetical protein